MTSPTVLLALTLLMAGPALADPPGAPPPSNPAHQRLFLSPSGEPFRPAPGAPEPFEAWFAQADTNHDGVIDRAEFRADAARFFKRVDTNGDGVIDGFEIAAYENKIVPELAAEAEGRFAQDGPGAQGRPPGDGGGGGHGRGGHHDELPAGGDDNPGAPGRGFQELLAEAEPVSGADFDLDGKVSYAEWMKAADLRFDLLDTAKTGRLTHDLLKARMAQTSKRKR